MRPFTSTISLEEARRRLDANVRPIARTERTPLHDAGGRVAAADVQSSLDVPPFARSAMDGYAVIAADLERASKDAPVSLRVLDRIYTGQLPTVTVLQQFRNLENRDGKGFEVGGDVSGHGAHLAVQYAYQEFKNVATGATIVNDIPKHKFSSGLGLTRGALELDAWVHVVSDTQVEGYVLLNPRVGVKLGSWVLSAQGFNMLNDRHVETVNGRGIKGETIGRLITASVSYRGR